MKPPIKLRRLYDSEGKNFIIVAEPLPAAETAHWTEAEHVKRREAERRAIDAERSFFANRIYAASGGRSPSGSTKWNGWTMTLPGGGSLSFAMARTAGSVGASLASNVSASASS